MLFVICFMFLKIGSARSRYKSGGYSYKNAAPAMRRSSSYRSAPIQFNDQMQNNQFGQLNGGYSGNAMNGGKVAMRGSGGAIGGGGGAIGGGGGAIGGSGGAIGGGGVVINGGGEAMSVGGGEMGGGGGAMSVGGGEMGGSGGAMSGNGGAMSGNGGAMNKGGNRINYGRGALGDGNSARRNEKYRNSDFLNFGNAEEANRFYREMNKKFLSMYESQFPRKRSLGNRGGSLDNRKFDSPLNKKEIDVGGTSKNASAGSNELGSLNANNNTGVSGTTKKTQAENEKNESENSDAIASKPNDGSNNTLGGAKDAKQNSRDTELAIKDSNEAEIKDQKNKNKDGNIDLKNEKKQDGGLPGERNDTSNANVLKKQKETGLNDRDSTESNKNNPSDMNIR
ncbi:hypothetical protein CWI38_0887p0010 [Hamiltosporidium tvaerminnensis]|uniref:Uncharacterized protein n=1 Tax=Hamiltosporidium tvaerminnensis TaxID=1176355 RepID=A0A4Q9LUU7_9MICR|nr:hypothetical protein CWI38_0887p0010 [Hamiltosporidium tvaerminnensis]